jgi:hypothetical protein
MTASAVFKVPGSDHKGGLVTTQGAAMVQGRLHGMRHTPMVLGVAGKGALATRV